MTTPKTKLSLSPLPPDGDTVHLMAGRTVVAIADADAFNIEILKRLVALQHACASMQDPAAEIAAMREALREVLALIEEGWLVRNTERDGCWFVIAEYLCRYCGQWKHADSIGMCIYANPLDPFENDYVVGLMATTLDKLN